MLDASQVFDGTLGTGLTAPTGAAITASRASTNVIDWLVARDMGAGNILGLHVLVTETFLTLTSLKVQFEVSADNSTYYDILECPVIPVAQLIATVGLFRYALPVNQLLNATAGVLKAPGRYCRLYYTVAGSNATAGAVVAWVNPALDRQSTYTYPRNYTA